MKLLVTGGAGFIGSNFIHHMLSARKDTEIVNLDCLNYAGNLANLSSLASSPRYTLVKGDVRSPQDVARCVTEDIDGVVNFAAQTHVDRSIVDSSDFVTTNVQGTQILLEACRRKKIPRFLQVSTDEVYGSLKKTGRFTEETPLAPNSPYAATKAAADLLARAYCRTYGMDIVVTRCGNNYGPYQFPEKFIPLMILNALQDKSLPVYGDGLYMRDWIHARDHCRALELILLKGRAGCVYNIGADDERKNLEVVHQILEVTNKPRELIQFVADRPGHDRRYAIDSSLLRRELEWHPEIPFHQGLRDTIGWYVDNQEWVERVCDGTYLSYYQRMYEDRDRTLSNL